MIPVSKREDCFFARALDGDGSRRSATTVNRPTIRCADEDSRGGYQRTWLGDKG